MKKLLFFAGVLTFSFASAQNPQSKIPPKSSLDTVWFPNTLMDIAKVVNRTPAQPEATLRYTLPNGNKVYALTQDNMACVVPDMSHLSMPFARPPLTGYHMPNPAALSQNNVIQPSPNKLNDLLNKRIQ